MVKLQREVYIVSACRTAIGSFAGSLQDTAPVDLGAAVVQAALQRTEAYEKAVSLVDEVIVGNVLGAGHGMNIARQCAIKAGLGVQVPAFTVNKVCGSGLKSVALGAAAIAGGESDVVVAGGVENMSQTVFVSKSSRWGQRMGHTELIDLMLQDGLTDAFHGCHMGITAENLAERYSVSREDQDRFALASQEKALKARESGFFEEEIVPVPLFKRGQQTGEFKQDEYPRVGVTLDGLLALKPAFKKLGTVTAGNSSGINDGAAAVVLMSAEKVEALGVKPMAQVLSWSSSGVDPQLMGTGPVAAVKKLLSRSSFELHDIDLIEANEAFSAQALSVGRLLEWDWEKVNVCGGAIALGHPIGASGTRILVTLLHQLRRLKRRIGLATLCVGGGQGIAMLVKSCD